MNKAYKNHRTYLCIGMLMVISISFLSAQEATSLAALAVEKQPAPEKLNGPAVNGSAELFNNAQLPLELQQPLTKRATRDDEERIAFNFEDADLENLLNQVADIFQVTFITDDIVNPMRTGGKAVRGNKFSFKTNKPLSPQEAWDLFLTFLDIAGLMTVPDGSKKRYRIMSTEAARKSPIPSYIGTDYIKLPANDQLIRYVYFIQNSTLDTIKPIVDSLRSSASAFFVLNDLNAFVLTDKSYNIQALMKIIVELDRISMPQAMSIMQLRYVDAEYAQKKYEQLVQVEDKSVTTRLFPVKKSQTTSFFPDNARIIAEPRTNRLILLGPKDSLKKIEDFIRNDIDKEVDKPYSPLRAYSLKYADATTVSNIMNDLVQFGKETEAGKSGGVRGRDKYFKPITFTPEPSTNRVIIKGDENDYLRVVDIIKSLDAPQPQVAVQILVLSVSVAEMKSLGTQLRSKVPGVNGLLGNNVEFATSGINLTDVPKGIATTTTGTGNQRLLADLINIVVGASAGNTVLSLGSDKYGVWGIFNALNTITDTQIVAKPFLVTINNKKATVKVGQIRRVIVSETIVGDQSTPSFDNDEADLTVEVTPQINSDGMILLNLDISFDQFTNPVIQTDATKTTKQIKTSTVVADQEVLALGGLVVNRATDSETKVPVLGDLPLIGWLFKNKNDEKTRDTLLVLISTRIIEAEDHTDVRGFTQGHIAAYHDTLNSMQMYAGNRDPINRWFFNDSLQNSENAVDKFLFARREREASTGKGDEFPRTAPQGVPVISPETVDPSPVASPEKQQNIVKSKRPSLADLAQEFVAEGAV